MLHGTMLRTMSVSPMYTTRAAVPETVETALAPYSPLMRQLLYVRGIETPEAAQQFLEPSYEAALHDPFLLTDMEKGVSRILAAFKNDEHIVLYTDYDCDGIPGGVLLHDFFTSIGYTNFENYIPHRHEEGYGFNAASVAQFKERGASLIITVDCGITDHDAVIAAGESGIDVIVTDHHEPSDTLPPAYAVINPKRDKSYPFSGLCGTGVAFKLALAILERGRAQGVVTLGEGQEKWLLDMVALATVADMVPLRDENRTLAHYGLRVLRKSRRPGLQQLLRTAGSDQRFLSEDDIGFTIAPRINAASRMDTPEDAFHMLRTKDEGEAGAYARHLEKLNNERKGVVAGMAKEVKKRMHGMVEHPPVIVLGNPEWRPSLVGLVANSLAEEFRRPVFLWGRDGRGILKGSCRSDGVVSTLRLMEAAREVFIEFGGHHFSGGFAVHEHLIHSLQDALLGAYETRPDVREPVTLLSYVDAALTLEDIDTALMRTLEALAPFGEENPKPLFSFPSVTPSQVLQFGKTGDHTKIVFETKRGKQEAIAFFKIPEDFNVVPEAGKPLTLIGHVETSYFRGRRDVRIRIVDLLPK